jgi:hypothetical protein
MILSLIFEEENQYKIQKSKIADEATAQLHHVVNLKNGTI